MTKPTLRLDWVDHKAAKYAVMNWHYSKTMPVGKMSKVGVWENGRYIGCVLFAQGNNQYQGHAYGITMHEVCELVRVALREHISPVSKIVSIALRMLKKQSPKLRLVLSYADPEQDHVGGIYQAGNWVYIGTGGSSEAFFTKDGKRVHSRMVSKTGVKEHFGSYTESYRTDDLVRVKLQPKYKYLMPLDDAMREQIAPLAKPYPKRRAEGVDSDTPGIQPGEGGAVPTSALHDVHSQGCIK